MNLLKKIIHPIKHADENEIFGMKFQFSWFYIILVTVCAIMTIINIRTSTFPLGYVVIGFGILNIVNYYLSKLNDTALKISTYLLVSEFILMCCFFMVHGTAEGFSVIWICLLPSCGLFLFGRKVGSIACLVMFFIMLFLFKSPYGQSLLFYDYTEPFKTRFPVLFVSFYLASLYLESLRATTEKKLIKAREEYKYLYNHDALTSLYNRHGFNAIVDNIFENGCPNGISLLIADIDHFKNINDMYGHINGDKVLIALANSLSNQIGNKGIVCRWGGEEFAIIIESYEGIFDLTESIRKNVESTEIELEFQPIHITISIGCYTIKTVTKKCANTLFARTDNNLYTAKNTGRNKVVADFIEKC